MAPLVKKIYRSRGVILEMLADRGYVLSDKLKINNLESVQAMLENYNLIIHVQREDNDHLFVFFHISQSKFDKGRLESTVTKIKETLDDDDVNIILIVQNVTPPVIKELNETQYEFVELFYYDKLRFNITKHQDVPRHILLTADEIASILEKHDIRLDQYPRINSATDPVARYYGARVGQMFKIIRRSESSGEAITYRVVY